MAEHYGCGHRRPVKGAGTENRSTAHHMSWRKDRGM